MMECRDGRRCGCPDDKADVMSHDERTNELIQMAVAGNATERDLAELDQMLAESAEEDVIRGEIESIALQLKGMPVAVLPAIKESVLTKISHEETAKIVASFRPKRRFAAITAWAIAASLVVGFGVYQWTAQRLQSSNSSAAMLRMDVKDWAIVANVPTSNAKFIVRRNGDLFAVQPVLASPVPIAIRWDAGRFDLDEAYPSANMGQDGAAVSFAASRKNPTIVLRRRPDAFGTTEIEFSAAGNDKATATVSLD